MAFLALKKGKHFSISACARKRSFVACSAGVLFGSASAIVHWAAMFDLRADGVEKFVSLPNLPLPKKSKMAAKHFAKKVWAFARHKYAWWWCAWCIPINDIHVFLLEIFYCFVDDLWYGISKSISKGNQSPPRKSPGHLTFKKFWSNSQMYWQFIRSNAPPLRALQFFKFPMHPFLVKKAKR